MCGKGMGIKLGRVWERAGSASCAEEEWAVHFSPGFCTAYIPHGNKKVD